MRNIEQLIDDYPQLCWWKKLLLYPYAVLWVVGYVCWGHALVLWIVGLPVSIGLVSAFFPHRRGVPTETEAVWMMPFVLLFVACYLGVAGWLYARGGKDRYGILL